MENKVENFGSLPQEQNEIIKTSRENIPENNDEIYIPVKFNKQIMNLDIESASNLAQKGLKFESIYEDFEKLKRLALDNGKSVSEYVNSLQQSIFESKREELTQKCGGDSDLAEHILKLEGEKKDTVRGFDELQKAFPRFKSLDALPESVIENAKLKGSLLLDEYLRYKLAEEMAVKNNGLQQRQAQLSSVGSQRSKKGIDNPEQAEFLKGLWNKN